MPFAQYHYPFENRELFESSFPADFICEGIDQTRGWFYTLHAIAAALFDKPAYKNLIVNELVLDKKGQKMSKSRGNVVDPFYVLEEYGADATRWYLTVNSPPWRQTMFNEKDIEGVQKNFFRALINTYQFFVLYAEIDGFTANEDEVPIEERPEIDQWILTELNALIRDVRGSMDRYDVTPAARAISEFTIDQLSNWYVRRNRRRFWKGEMSQDKLAAFQTLHRCLVVIAQLMSPIAPFMAENLYRRLTASLEDPAISESVHLALLPDPGHIDDALMRKMHDAQRVVYLTRGLREQTRLKTRQPLARILIATGDDAVAANIRAMRDVILEETNIHEIEFIPGDSDLLRKSAKPNFKSIGPKYGKLVKPIAARVSQLTADEINNVERAGQLELDIDGEQVTLGLEDIEIRHEDIEGWTIGSDDDVVVALDTSLTEELIDEGIAREFISRIQGMRKDADFEVTDRIQITIFTEEERLKQAIDRRESYICAETLAKNIVLAQEALEEGTDLSVNDLTCSVSISSALDE